jgi:hypothetical protein
VALDLVIVCEEQHEFTNALVQGNGDSLVNVGHGASHSRHLACRAPDAITAGGTGTPSLVHCRNSTQLIAAGRRKSRSSPCTAALAPLAASRPCKCVLHSGDRGSERSAVSQATRALSTVMSARWQTLFSVKPALFRKHYTAAWVLHSVFPRLVEGGRPAGGRDQGPQWAGTRGSPKMLPRVARCAGDGVRIGAMPTAATASWRLSHRAYDIYTAVQLHVAAAWGRRRCYRGQSARGSPELAARFSSQHRA